MALVTAHLARAAGGVATAAADLAWALRGHTGVDAHLVGVRHPAQPTDWRAWPDLPVHALRQAGPSAIGWAPAMPRTLAALDCDLCHAQGLWMYPSLASRGRHARTGRPYLVSPHGMLDPWALGRSRARKALAGLWFERGHLRGAACLQASSRGELAAIRAFGLRNPVAVVPPGVAAAPADPSGRGPAPWPPRPAGGPDEVLLYLGRLHPKKGVLPLLRAWADLVAAGPAADGWRLVVAGWGEPAHVAAVHATARGLGLGDRLVLPGPLHGEGKAAALRHAGGFVLPSFGEGLPLAVLEAWAHGLPVLMTPACNLPEGFAAGAAIPVAAEPGALAEALRAFIALPAAERAAMGAAGRSLAADRFAWPAAGRAVAEVYRWVLGGGPPPSCVATD